MDHQRVFGVDLTAAKFIGGAVLTMAVLATQSIFRKNNGTTIPASSQTPTPTPITTTETIFATVVQTMVANFATSPVHNATGSPLANPLQTLTVIQFLAPWIIAIRQSLLGNLVDGLTHWVSAGYSIWRFSVGS